MFHVHTYRCGHALGTEEQLVYLALKAGEKEIMFTDHAPFYDNRFGNRMRYEEMDAYIEELRRLRDKYWYKIRVGMGFEIEYFSEYEEYYRELTTIVGAQYLLLGQHIFYNKEGELRFFSKCDLVEDVRNYSKALCDGIRTGYFSVIAHPDVIVEMVWKNRIKKEELTDSMKEEFKQELKSATVDLVQDVIRATKTTEAILEMNVSRLRKEIFYGQRDQEYEEFIYENFWKRIADEKMECIIGCDIHNPKYIQDQALTKTKELTDKWGLLIVE